RVEHHRGLAHHQIRCPASPSRHRLLGDYDESALCVYSLLLANPPKIALQRGDTVRPALGAAPEQPVVEILALHTNHPSTDGDARERSPRREIEVLAHGAVRDSTLLGDLRG